MHELEESFELDPASAGHDANWFGTASAEHSVVEASNNMYELAGLDRERWMILAANALGFSHGAEPRWTVDFYAADKHALNISTREDWRRVEAQPGGVPVTEVRAHDLSFDDLVKCMKSVEVQLRSPANVRLQVTHRADHPSQD